MNLEEQLSQMRPARLPVTARRQIVQTMEQPVTRPATVFHLFEFAMAAALVVAAS